MKTFMKVIAGVSVTGVVIGIIMAIVNKEKGCQYESSNI